MPIYEYKCDNEHRFEAFQSMAEDSLTECEVCGAPAQRVLSAPAVHFKGSGFYTTDYARKGKKGGSGDSDSGSSESKSDSSSDKKSDSGSGSGNGSSGSKSESKSSSSSKD